MRPIRRAPAWCVLHAFVLLPSVSSWAASPKDPLEVTEGRLATVVRKQVVDVPLEHTDVRIEVSGHLADVTVVQTFGNPYANKINAVYLFPLPTNSAVHGMDIRIGERQVVGEIKPREEARKVFKRAKKRGHVAALLTQERPNLFTQRVANIEPGRRIEVTLRYAQTLEYEAGGYEVVFPMVAPPRYVPAKSSKAAKSVQPTVLPPHLRSSHEINLEVTFAEGMPVTGLESPSHELRLGDRRVAIAPGDTIPNRDFVLRYQVVTAGPELAVLTHRRGERGSFLLVAQPPAVPRAAAIAPRELIFVVDTSSSMRGLALAKARALVRRSLEGMEPHDTFQIVRFDADASALGPAMVANKPDNVRWALGWLDQLEASGTTEMIDGLEAALAFPHDPLRLRIVVLVTDGYIGNEDEVLAAVSGRVGEARMYAFGVGSAVNRYLLEGLAEMGRGALTVVTPAEETDAAVQRFYRRIDRPLLTDLRIDWQGLDVKDVVPRRLPDLFAGQPIVLAGRYHRGGASEVLVHARQAGRDVTIRVPVELPQREHGSPAIGQLWARRRIHELSRELIRGARPELEQQIRGLALEHRLMSRYTAFVAVDWAQTTGDQPARDVVVPVEVPRGVLSYSLEGGGGSGAVSMVMASASYASAPARIHNLSDGPAMRADPFEAGRLYAADRALKRIPAPKPPSEQAAGTPVPRKPAAEIEPPSDEEQPVEAAGFVTAKQRADVFACYVDALDRRPHLKGHLKLLVRIAKDGTVEQVRIAPAGTTLLDPLVRVCAIAAAQRWKFQPADKAKTVEVPFDLTPTR